MKVGGLEFTTVGVAGSWELYRRGLAATAGKIDPGNRAKHRAIREKLQALATARDQGS